MPLDRSEPGEPFVLLERSAPEALLSLDGSAPDEPLMWSDLLELDEPLNPLDPLERPERLLDSPALMPLSLWRELPEPRPEPSLELLRDRSDPDEAFMLPLSLAASPDELSRPVLRPELRS